MQCKVSVVAKENLRRRDRKGSEGVSRLLLFVGVYLWQIYAFCESLNITLRLLRDERLR